jgi:hypothetical protein
MPNGVNLNIKNLNIKGIKVNQQWKASFYRMRRFLVRARPEYPSPGPVYKSFIRKKQERKILQTLEGGENVLIRGPYRIGKTSMLTNLMAHFKRTGAILISPQGCGVEIKDAKGLKKFLKEEIHWSFDGVTVSSDDPLGELAQKCERPFLALDEIIMLGDNPDALDYIKNSLSAHKNLRAALVIHAGAENDKIVRDFFSSLGAHFITAVSRGETKELVLKPLGGHPEIFAPFVEKIYELSGGIPILVNRLCRGLVRIIKSSDSAIVAEEAIKDFLNMGKEFQALYRQGLEGLLKGLALTCLSPEDKKIIVALVSGQSLRDAFLERVAYLSQLGMIRTESDSATYKINGEILQFYYHDIFIRWGYPVDS